MPFAPRFVQVQIQPPGSYATIIDLPIVAAVYKFADAYAELGNNPLTEYVKVEMEGTNPLVKAKIGVATIGWLLTP